jgi:hypothetical protein
MPRLAVRELATTVSVMKERVLERSEHTRTKKELVFIPVLMILDIVWDEKSGRLGIESSCEF